MNVLQLAGMTAHRATEAGAQTMAEPTDWAAFAEDAMLTGKKKVELTEIEAEPLPNAESDLLDKELQADVDTERGEVETKTLVLKQEVSNAFSVGFSGSGGAEIPGDREVNQDPELASDRKGRDQSPEINLVPGRDAMAGPVSGRPVDLPHANAVPKLAIEVPQKYHSGTAQANVEAALITVPEAPDHPTLTEAESGESEVVRQRAPEIENQRGPQTVSTARLSGAGSAIDVRGFSNRADPTVVEDNDPKAAESSTNVRTDSMGKVENIPTFNAAEMKNSPNIAPLLQQGNLAESLKIADENLPRFDMQGSRTVAGAQMGSLQMTLSTPSTGTANHPVMMQISQAVETAETDKIELRLDPVELGKVRITMAARDGIMIATITAERAETLELLRRNSDSLDMTFGEQGFGETELSFEQYGDGEANDDHADQNFQSVVGEGADDGGIVAVHQPTSVGLDIRL